jgi:hypothetical protein
MPEVIATTKVCNRCGQEKKVNEFNRGHLNCKRCYLDLLKARYWQDDDYREKRRASNREVARNRKHIAKVDEKRRRIERQQNKREMVAKLWQEGKSLDEISASVLLSKNWVRLYLRASSVGNTLPDDDTEVWKITERKCIRCHIVLPIANFPRVGHWRINRCTKCSSAKSGGRNPDPRKRMYCSSKRNALTRGLEHTIQPCDIHLPEYCTYLGIRIDYTRSCDKPVINIDGKKTRRGGAASSHWYSPSIDRIDSSLGYIPGNIQVISRMANVMKQDATIEQLTAFARGVLRTHGEQAHGVKALTPKAV